MSAAAVSAARQGSRGKMSDGEEEMEIRLVVSPVRLWSRDLALYIIRDAECRLKHGRM